MAIKKIYFGTVGPFEFDDAELIEDPDGDFAGEYSKGVTTNSQISVSETPSEDEHLIRLVDVGVSVAASVHAADTKATPIDADEVALADSEDEYTLKNLTWANIKATLKTYFDTLYGAIGIHGNGETDATLSGTPKLFVVKDSEGTTYYFKGYPTKT